MICPTCGSLQHDECKEALKEQNNVIKVLTQKYMTMKEFLASEYGNDPLLDLPWTTTIQLPSYDQEEDEHLGIHFCEDSNVYYINGMINAERCKFASYEEALEHLIENLG